MKFRYAVFHRSDDYWLRWYDFGDKNYIASIRVDTYKREIITFTQWLNVIKESPSKKYRINLQTFTVVESKP